MPLRHGPHHFVVFDNQHLRGMMPRRAVPGTIWVVASWSQAAATTEKSSPARRALDLQGAMMTRTMQAPPRARARGRRLRAEKRIANFRERLGRHANRVRTRLGLARCLASCAVIMGLQVESTPGRARLFGCCCRL